MQLYPLVQSRDRCQHEQGLEPGVDSIVDNEEEAVEEPAMEKRAFVPKRTRKAETKDVLAEAVSCMNKMVEKDNTKEYLDFLREENDKDRAMRLEMFKTECQSFMQMMMPTPHQQPTYQQPHYHISQPTTQPAMFTPVNPSRGSLRSPRVQHMSSSTSTSRSPSLASSATSSSSVNEQEEDLEGFYGDHASHEDGHYNTYK